MDTLQVIFYVAALVLLLLAAFGVAFRRVAFGWAGLACWLVAAAIIPMLD